MKARWKILFFLVCLALAFLLGLNGKKWIRSLNKKQRMSSSQKSYPVVESKRFVVVIPSYNNQKWVERNLRSVLEQNYSCFRVIYIDDASTDGTYEAARQWIALLHKEEIVALQRNSKNLGAAENYFRAISTCAPNEIVLMLDGDDWLAHEDVLQRLNAAYADPNVWMTYGSYLEYPSYSYTIGKYCGKVPEKVVQTHSVRQYVKTVFPFSHLKTFYAGLFHQIPQADLMFEGKFFDAASDQAIILPIFEMAGMHYAYIRDILYIYNRSSPLNTDKLRADRQQQCAAEVHARPAYESLKALDGGCR